MEMIAFIGLAVIAATGFCLGIFAAIGFIAETYIEDHYGH